MICIQVSIALQLQDDFSGASLASAAPRFYIDNNCVVPIKKPEGFFVFTQSISAQSVLTVKVAGYFPLEIPAQNLMCASSQAILQLRLLRSSASAKHVSKGDSTYLVGSAPPLTRVVACSGKQPPLHLQGAGTKDGVGWVLLQGPHPVSPINRRFCVESATDTQYFIIVGRNRDGTFALQDPLREGAVQGAQVRRVYTALSDAQGAYELFVDAGQTAEDLQQIYLEREGIDWEYKYVMARN